MESLAHLDVSSKIRFGLYYDVGPRLDYKQEHFIVAAK